MLNRGTLGPIMSMFMTAFLLVGLCIPLFVPSHHFVGYSSYEQSSNETFRYDPWEIASASAAALAAAFAGVLALLNGIQIKDTRRSSERQIRAYVGIVGSSIVDFAVDKAPTVSVAFRNDGQTPAYDFYSCIGVCIGPFPLPDGMEIPGESVAIANGKVNFARIGTGILTPSHQKHMSQTLGITISPDEMINIKEGKRALYAYGFARYRDAFNRYWHLEFRYFSGGPGSAEFLYDEKSTEQQIDQRMHASLLRMSGKSFELVTNPTSKFAGAHETI